VEHGFQQIEGHAFSIVATLLHPFSRGDIRLRSNNPLDAPAIRGNYFSDERDMKVMLEVSKDRAGPGSYQGVLQLSRKRASFPGADTKDDSAFRAPHRQGN